MRKMAALLLSFAALGCKSQSASQIQSQKENPVQEIAPLVIPKSSFPAEVMSARDKFCAASVDDENFDNSDLCPKTKTLVIDIFNSLVDRAGLRTWFSQEKSFRIGIRCESSIRSPFPPKVCGNTMYLTTGFMLGFASEDELAAVIAHEMMHYLRSHDESIVQKYLLGTDGTDTVSKSTVKRINKQKKENEFEADALSIILLHYADYATRASLSALANVKKQMVKEHFLVSGFADLYPTRVAKLEVALQKKNYETKSPKPGRIAEAVAELVSLKK
jgi:hypothetical protein